MKCMRTITMSFPAYRGSPEVYGRINMRHCNNFYPESVINPILDGGGGKFAPQLVF